MKKFPFILTQCIALLYLSCSNSTEPSGSTSPNALFYVDKLIFEVDEQVYFSNTSRNSDTYLWYFGDGDSSAVKNPTHSYSDIGRYNVTLIASKNTKSDTFEKELTVFTEDEYQIQQGESYTFSYSTTTSFPPAVLDVQYTGEGHDYLTFVGQNLTFIDFGTEEYLSTAGFIYDVSDDTPTGNYIGKFTITFTAGNDDIIMEKNVLLIIVESS